MGPNPLQLRLFGGVELRSDRAPDAPPPGRKVRALLAYLALSPGLPCPREKLMALLWSDRAEEQARASLRQALTELRHALGEPSPLRTGQDTVSLDSLGIVVDAVEFPRLVKAGKLAEAAALYRGPLLDGHGVRDGAFEDWLRIERTRLHDLAVDALHRLATSQSGEAAIATAQRLLQIDPAREDTHRLLMQLYAAGGQRVQAIRQYQLCRDALERELQAKPNAETERLYRQIQDEAPVAPAPSITSIPARALSSDGKPSIAILPFENLSGDPEQLYFSRGITADIITELSRFHEIQVTARNSSFAFDQRSVGLREIAAKLGIDYLVEGSVRRAGNRVRVSVQLIDAETLGHVWAEHYDRDLADVFDLQDEVARMIATTVPGRVRAVGTERAHRKPTENMSAYENYLRALEYLDGYDRLALAEPFILRAVELDPRFAMAQVLLCLLTVNKYFFDADRSHLEKAAALGRKALALDESDGMCHVAVAHPLTFQRRHDEAGSYYARAVALNSNNTFILMLRAMWLNYMGRSVEALATIEACLRRDPVAQDWYWDVLAMVQTAAGRYAEALASYERMKQVPYWAHAFRAICHVGMDQLPVARAAAAEYVIQSPRGTVASFLDLDPYADPAVVNRFRAALLAAGVPEG
jgi:TolB-like protein/Tfp pilus assembly protein PilF